MNTLPNEIILLIFDNIILITDKRQFLKTCVHHNNITKQSMQKFEKNYNIKNYKNINNYCVEKFALELCHDKYFDMIPLSYIIPNNTILVRALVEFDCLQLLKIAKSNGCNLDDICFNASCYDNLKILIWARGNGYWWNSRICAFAAKNGNLEMLKWARQHGCKWDIDTCSSATINNHLDVLIWARKNGCEWNYSVCTYAAIFNRLEILIWARENGCKWNSDVRNYAKASGHEELLQWAINNGCP